MVEKSADITFLSAFLMVLRNVTVVLVVPLLLALLSRRVVPGFVEKVKRRKNLAFYLWCINLSIVTGVTIKNITHSGVGGWLLALLLLLPLVVTIAQFAIGKAVGRPFGASISAGQALGQKNTVVGIWLLFSCAAFAFPKKSRNAPKCQEKMLNLPRNYNGLLSRHSWCRDLVRIDTRELSVNRHEYFL